MKNKLLKNTFFLIAIIIIVSFIVIFNFCMDPYFIFNQKLYLNTNDFPRNYIHIALKAYKNQKYDTVLIGASESVDLFALDIFAKFFNKLSINSFGYREQYQLLKDYIKIHPETKKIYIVVSYLSYLNSGSEPISEQKGVSDYTLDELIFVLFSKDTTLNSIKRFKQGKPFKPGQIFEKVLEQSYYKFNPELRFSYFPNIMYGSFVDEKIKSSSILYIKKMVEFLNEKNIDYTFIIPPYNARYQSIIFDSQKARNEIDNLKRMLVNLSKNDVYDFGVINKYTKSPLKENNVLYFDFVHANFIMGMKIFKVFHDGISEDGLYMLLNKKNIEKQLEIQHKILNKYYNDNLTEIQEYVRFDDKKQNNDNLFYYKDIYLDSDNLTDEQKERIKHTKENILYKKNQLDADIRKEIDIIKETAKHGDIGYGGSWDNEL